MATRQRGAPFTEYDIGVAAARAAACAVADGGIGRG
jgi:hypothetical protein